MVFRLQRRAVTALSLLLAGSCCMVMLQANAVEVSGKVVGVFHEKVTTPAPESKTFDKVSATVIDCADGQFKTVHYPLGYVSEANSMGHLFRQLANAARTTSTKNQYMNSVGGHATFETDDNSLVNKTTLWGHNWECGRNLDSPAGAIAGAGNPAGGQNAASSSSAAAPAQTPQSSGGSTAGKVFGGLGKVRRFGF